MVDHVGIRAEREQQRDRGGIPARDRVTDGGLHRVR
jgi:hypothetical protein